MKFTLAEAITNVLRETGMTKTEAESASRKVNALLEGALQEGDEIVLGEVGSVAAVQISARKGRNPANGDILQLPARRALRFKAYRAFRRRMNEGADSE